MTNKEAIERWAKYIVPAVFTAENRMLKKHPEWNERLKNIKGEDPYKVAEEYCIAIATEIVTNADDFDNKDG